MKKIILIGIVLILLINHMYAQTPHLWGLANLGGLYNKGVLYKINGDGTGYTNHYNFNDTLGRYPQYKLMFNYNNNKFYGVCPAGGQLGDNGVLFSFDTLTNTYSDIHDFNTLDSSGRNPCSSLIQLNNGLLYGLAAQTSSGSQAGLLYNFNTTNSAYTKLVDFDTNYIQSPLGGDLLEFGTNKLYGLLGNDTIHTDHGSGGIFRFDVATSTYTELYHFDFYHGTVPQGNGLIHATNNILYGMTYGGGDTTNNFTQGYGVIFSFDTTTNTVTNLMNFTGTNGHHPYRSFIQAANGLLYGMTSQGGTNNKGVLFSFNIATNAQTILVNFSGTNGADPRGSLMQASDGKLYGTTRIGGLNNKGLIFSYDIITNTFTDIHDFNGTDGASSYELVELNNETVGLPKASIQIGISIYPNPASTFLNIHHSTYTTPETLLITDLLGTVVYKENLTGIDNTISISTWSAGIYFYEIKGEKEIVRGKFVIL